MKEVFKTIYNFIEKNFSAIVGFFVKHITSVAIFFAGVLLGILVFLFIYKILSRKMKNLELKQIESVNPILIREEIIGRAVKFYEETYTNSTISEKLEGFKEISFSLIQSIATKYYPNSTTPIMEINSDDLIKLLKDVSTKIYDMLVSFLDDNIIYSNIFKAGISIININKEEKTSLEWRELKIKEIKELLEPKPKTAEKNTFWSRLLNKVKKPINDISMKLIKPIVDNKIKALIVEIGEEVNLVYSKRLGENNEIYLKNAERGLSDYEFWSDCV